MATGKKSGNKSYSGDHRTPEGIYRLTEFIPKSKLLKMYGKEGEIYGIGAFVLDYPNPIDNQLKKTGGGIWIHSTNDETRIEKGLDSRGCIVVANKDLIDISRFIELNKTSVVVVQDLHYLSQKSWALSKENLKNFLDNWLTSWKEENFKSYISNYHPTNFTDPFRGSFTGFRNYKKAVFNGPGRPEISISNISILNFNSYAMVTFIQNYKSNTINDTGVKTLYLQKDKFYNWKIVSEKWRKVIDTISNDNAKFLPSDRFFKKDNIIKNNDSNKIGML